MIKFKWEKYGRIFNPENRFHWMQNYAQVPTPVELEQKVRIYFTTRPAPDAEGNYISTTSFVDVSKQDLAKVLYMHNMPVMQPGKPGCFDEFGIMPGCLLRDENSGDLKLYYTGWTRLTSVPYCTQIGMAISKDEGFSFTKISDGPVMGLSSEDPYLINGPFILRENGLYHMWYASGKEWFNYNKKMETIYLIKHAWSEDSINWNRDGDFCIPTVTENEAQNRPSVFKYNNKYIMLFSYRKGIDFRNNKEASYKIGFAVSTDLKEWTRSDINLLTEDLGESWDSQMQAYPYPFILNSELYIMYNGNCFGKNGFGLAKASIEE